VKRTDLMDVIYSADAAIKHVLENWQKGDLAGAVRELQAVKDGDIKSAIEWWESEPE
jgi:hypothetical protein